MCTLTRLTILRAVQVIAIFGPTGVGKTEVAIALADRLRRAGEDPVAVSADAMQVYDGLPILSGAATPAEQQRLEHRLLGFVPVSEPFSAGAYARRAHAEIDAALAAGRRPLVVGGTGLYLRAALAELDLRPPAPRGPRAVAGRARQRTGRESLHAELARRAPGLGERHRRRRRQAARPDARAARRRRAAARRRAATRSCGPPTPATRRCSPGS